MGLGHFLGRRGDGTRWPSWRLVVPLAPLVVMFRILAGGMVDTGSLAEQSMGRSAFDRRARHDRAIHRRRSNDSGNCDARLSVAFGAAPIVGRTFAVRSVMPQVPITVGRYQWGATAPSPPALPNAAW